MMSFGSDNMTDDHPMLVLLSGHSGGPYGLPQRRRGAVGMTLVECAVAIAIVSASTLAITLSTMGGYGQLTSAERQALAVRMADDLLEEIAGAPYGAGGGARPHWGLDDYDGLVEAPGEVRDFLGESYDTGGYTLTRSTSVSSTSLPVSALGGVTISGKTVTVTLRDAEGREWRLSRFVPEPAP